MSTSGSGVCGHSWLFVSVLQQYNRSNMFGTGDEGDNVQGCRLGSDIELCGSLDTRSDCWLVMCKLGLGVFKSKIGSLHASGGSCL